MIKQDKNGLTEEEKEKFLAEIIPILEKKSLEEIELVLKQISSNEMNKV